LGSPRLQPSDKEQSFPKEQVLQGIPGAKYDLTNTIVTGTDDEDQLNNLQSEYGLSTRRKGGSLILWTCDQQRWLTQVTAEDDRSHAKRTTAPVRVPVTILLRAGEIFSQIPTKTLHSATTAERAATDRITL
jgi:hypothetical protein